MAVVKNLMVRAGADFSAMKKEMQKAQADIKKFKTGMSAALKGIGLALATLGIGTIIKDATKSAMEVESAMMQIKRTMGDSSQAFMDWANEGAKAFNMGRSSALKYGAIYSNLLSTFTNDTAETTKFTKDLLKASAITSAATGRTMEDVMWRIRSGLLGNTEAIEDLGINVYVNMLESTKAFRKFAGDKSWDQLDFQTQQQIRYFGILEQVAVKFGGEVRDNTSSRLAAFTETLKDVKTALGNAFLPILNAVLPSLTRMAESLLRVMNIVAQFFTVLFGKAEVSNAQADSVDAQAGAVTGLGDAYKDAGKKARGAVAGFDEVNQLADSAGGGLAGGSAPTVPVVNHGDAANGLNEVGKQTEEIARKVREAAEKVKNVYGQIKEAVIDLWDTLKPFTKWLVDEYAFNFGIVGSVITWLWKNVTIPMGNAEVWLWKEVLVPFGNWLKDYFIGFWRGVGEAMKWVWEKVLVPIGGAFKDLWNKVMIPFGTWLKDKFAIAWNGVKDAANNLWKQVLVPLGDFVKKFWNETLVPFGNFLKDTFVGAWNKVKEAANGLWKNVIVPFGSALSTLWNDTMIPFGNWLKNIFAPAWDSIGTAVGNMKTEVLRIWGEVEKETKKIWDNIVGGIKSTINTVISAVNRFINRINGIEINIPSVEIFGEKIGGGKISMPKIPNIPELAKGGITSGPTLAMIGDNPGGQEVVSPLDGLLDMIQSAVGSAVLAASQMNGGGQQGDIVLNIDGRTFARVVGPFAAKETARIGGSMITST